MLKYVLHVCAKNLICGFNKQGNISKMCADRGYVWGTLKRTVGYAETCIEFMVLLLTIHRNFLIFSFNVLIDISTTSGVKILEQS